MNPEDPLVESLRARDPRALAEAYRREGARVYRLCLRILGRTADAEDAVQDVFLKLFEAASSFSGRSRFSTWLHRLTVNHCLHRIERERLRETAPLPEDGAIEAARSTCPVESFARMEAREGLHDLLARLSVEHRVVLVLREIEELSYQEIAETLAIPVGTVMSRLARAREQLVRQVGAREPKQPRPKPPAIRSKR